MRTHPVSRRSLPSLVLGLLGARRSRSTAETAAETMRETIGETIGETGANAGTAAATRRPRRNTTLAVLFAILALNAWAQAALALAGRSSDPVPLMLAQALVGLAAAATAVGSWRVRPWASAAALAYAVVGATMIASLDLMLDLPPGAHVGLLTGAAIIFLFGAWAAWYLRARGPVRASTAASA